MRWALALSLVAGCGGGTPAAPDAAVGPRDAKGGGDVDAPPAGPGLAGVLLDPDGQPLPRTDVLACMATTCLFGESDADGRFAFAIEPPAEVALKTHADLDASPRRAAALEPVRLVDGTRVDVGSVYTPDLPAGAILGPASDDPQTLAAGDGLELTLHRADLTPAIGDALFDVAARALPADRVPSYPELAGRTVLAVYALHPFAATSASPIAVRAPVALPDGTAVEVRVVSELDGLLSAPIPAHVSGGVATTDAGEGITRLTYLVIVQGGSR